MSPGRQRFCCIPLSNVCFILGYTNMTLNVFLNAGLILSIFFIGAFNVPLDACQILLIVVICVNAFWMIINIICLLGLHNKKPVNVWAFLFVASSRMFLSLALYTFVLMAPDHDVTGIVIIFTDIVLNASYILAYYAYVGQIKLELEAQANAVEAPFEAPITFKPQDDNIYLNKTEKTIYLLK